MEPLKSRIVSDISLHNRVVISVLAILLFNVFGVLGLVGYGIVLTYSILFLLFNLKRQRLYRNITFYAMLAFAIYYFISMVVNGDFMLHATSLMQYLSLGLIALFIREPDEIESDYLFISKFLTLACIVMTLLSFTTDYQTDGRLTGLAGHPNRTASYCQVCSLFSLYLIFNKSSAMRWKIASAVNIALSSIMIFFMTTSRTSAAILAVSSFLYALHYLFVSDMEKKLKRRIFIAFCILCMAMLLLMTIFILSSPRLQEKMNDLVRLESLSTLSNRTSIWQTILEFIKDNWLFGFSRNTLENATGLLSAHNLFFQALAFSGYPGLILYTVFFFSTCILAFRLVLSHKQYSAEIQPLICLLATFCVSFFLYGLTEGIHTMRLIGVMFAFVSGSIATMNSVCKR